MIQALNMEPVALVAGGVEITLRRPTVADFVAFQDATQRGVNPAAWYVWNHVVKPDGRRAFASVEQVLELPFPWVRAVAQEVDQLYGEGVDLRRADATCSRPPA